MKNISSNKNLITIAVVCVCCVIIFAAVVVLIARGKSDGSDDNTIINGSVGGTQIDQNGNLIVAEGSDYIPESCVGSWEVSKDAHVLQSPRNTDMSEEDAVKAEYKGEGVLLAYDSYKTSRTGSVFSPFYKVKNNCSRDLMDAVGMQSDGILDEFGDDAMLTQIQVYDQGGTNLYDTIFIVNDQYLIYYGTGNFVFAATKVEAVG